MKRVAVLVALAATGFVASVTASATTMPVVTAGVGNGSASVTTCDPDGFTASGFTTAGGKVTAVTLSGIAAACTGGQLSVTLTQGTTSVASGGPVTVTAGSATVTLTGNPDAWNVDTVRAVVIGP